MIVEKRVPPIHTQRNESSPWDGCWAFALAMGADAASGGKLLWTEAQIRKASSKPDRPRRSDGGNIDDQLDAIKKLAPKLKIQARPSDAALRKHLADGGGAVVSCYARDLPKAHHKVDPGFYSKPRILTGHGVFLQGTGDGTTAYLMDPLLPAGAKPAKYPIADLVKAVWGSPAKRDAILVWPALKNNASKPPADQVRIVAGASWWDYAISGSVAEGYEIGRDDRITLGGFTADIEPISPHLTNFEWGGRNHTFAKVATGPYIGSWVDLLEGDRIKHLPAV